MKEIKKLFSVFICNLIDGVVTFENKQPLDLILLVIYSFPSLLFLQCITFVQEDN